MKGAEVIVTVVVSGGLGGFIGFEVGLKVAFWRLAKATAKGWRAAVKR